MKIRQMKYGNKTTHCRQNHSPHQSGLEAAYCNELALLKKGKVIKGFQTQARYDLHVKGKKICEHYVDFLVTNKDGHLEVHETKGFATAAWNLKRKLFEALHPEIPYHVITGRSRTWRSRSKLKKRKWR